MFKITAEFVPRGLPDKYISIPSRQASVCSPGTEKADPLFAEEGEKKGKGRTRRKKRGRRGESEKRKRRWGTGREKGQKEKE